MQQLAKAQVLPDLVLEFNILQQLDRKHSQYQLV
jgi:hypothetical protein